MYKTNVFDLKKLTLIFLLPLFGVISNIFPRVFILVRSSGYLLSDKMSFILLIIFITFSSLFLLFKRYDPKVTFLPILFSLILGYLLVGIFIYYFDFLHFLIVTNNINYTLLNMIVLEYFKNEWWLYVILTLGFIFNFNLLIGFKKAENNNKKLLLMIESCLSFTLIFFVFLFPLEFINILLFKHSNLSEFIALPIIVKLGIILVYLTYMTILLAKLFLIRKKESLKIKDVVMILNTVIIFLSISIIFELSLEICAFYIMLNKLTNSFSTLFFQNLSGFIYNIIPEFFLLMLLLIFSKYKKYLKSKINFCENGVDNTTGNFGSAKWATKEDLSKLNAYNEDNGIPMGADEDGKLLFLPLTNKLIISPPGGGKTTSVTIPALLTHNGPVFALDVKGELWAVTARYRSEVMGRNVVVIDPFDVTKQADFIKGKPSSLLKNFRINPYDWIPESKKARDRMINAFAASLVINEKGYINHFDDNARILIRGFTDYMMNLDSKHRVLPTLFNLMSERIEEAKITFDQMTQIGGRAGAAANQINRVGSDERGSILSTSYRQIDWMGDSNIQELLCNSNFDLRDFLKGNMDIFVVLPEDQVKEYSRLFRMIMCLLMTIIIQANPSELPRRKMLFLLEEVAQLGASPDIEQCIEVLRARGVVIWTVFQTLKQIAMFDKPDLFLTIPQKQIFTTDDKETMEWIQTLGADKTILTKTVSSNSGDSRQKMQLFSGSVSSGEGESLHETGVKLIQLNEISGLHENEQFVFLKGKNPIKCKKVKYFEHQFYNGKYDDNPLETWQKS